ncbi:MAG: DUF2851 family protein [Bacteroidia bacterium]
MTEEFLHHIWKFRLFDQLELKTTNGDLVEILHPGEHNFDSGPDFFNARIKVNGTLWAGNVEVHINASDWNKHFHQRDKAYDNIVLHVVHHADITLYRRSGEEIPAVELKSRIGQKQYYRYLDFKTNKDWIPCAKQVAAVPSLVFNNTMDRMVSERLERKSISIINDLKLHNNNWEETFYRHLARNFGFKTNAEPFELLAKSLPLVTLARHRNSLFQLEALLFGQAGMLEEHLSDKYALQLQNEYAFLKKKLKLQPIEKHLWKFLRLRPVNFPGIRIAQFAALIHRSQNLFSKMLEIGSLEELKELLNVKASEYWEEHFMLDRKSGKREKHLGEDGMSNVLINTIVPFLFVYGRQKGEAHFCDKAFLLLEQTKGEDNAMIRNWKRLNVPAETACATQALIQLKNSYCDAKQCLSCGIGNYLVKNS